MVRDGESFQSGITLSKEQDWGLTSCWPSSHAENNTRRCYATRQNKTRSVLVTLMSRHILSDRHVSIHVTPAESETETESSGSSR